MDLRHTPIFPRSCVAQKFVGKSLRPSKERCETGSEQDILFEASLHACGALPPP